MLRIKAASIVSAAAGFLFCGCSDIVRSEFPTWASASEIVANCWIPKILPESTTEIQEWHDLDLNIGGGTFRFSARDANSFQEALRPYSNGDGATPVSRTTYEDRGYAFYSTEFFHIAIDWNRQIGEFWLIPSGQ